MPYTTVLEPLNADQWLVDSLDLREFVATAKEIISSTTHNRAETLNALEPQFAALLKKRKLATKTFYSTKS